jgi:hypothetical protein
VRLEGHRISFFANMLPPGGWHFEALATAVSVGKTPLCVLGTRTNAQNINLLGTSYLLAPDCGIHSNGDISGAAGAHMVGLRIQAKGTASGPVMTPLPGQSAAIIDDPFASMSFPSLDPTCAGKFANGNTVYLTYGDNGTHYLDPVMHCQPISVDNQTTLVLKPGNHFFYKNVRLQGSGRLEGEDVFLFFDRGSDTIFGGTNLSNRFTSVNLVGRKSGPYAGMVMATVSGGSPNIILPGDRIERLIGVVYVKNGFLEVNGSGVAAEDSAWTVIVARQVSSTGTARIQINADYGSSDVPVPKGVGPNAGGLGGTGTRLLN